LERRPNVSLSPRAQVALVIAVLGVAISIVPTVLFIFLIENKREDPLGWEIFADLPLHLLTAFIGAVIGLVGALLFRWAVRRGLEDADAGGEVKQSARLRN